MLSKSIGFLALVALVGSTVGMSVAESEPFTGVASAIDGITDHIRHEQTGLLFPSGDTAALASALERILTDASLRQRLGPAGAEYSRTDLDWNVLVKRIRSEVYQQVAGR